MDSHDRKPFAEAMNQLFAIYGDEVTDKLRDAWWGILSPYRLNAVMAAMNLHAADTAAGMYRPTPAHIRNHLENTMPALMKERRDAVLREARTRMAPHEEAIARIEADVRLGLLNEGDAAKKTLPERRAILSIRGEPDVALALAPMASLRDDEVQVGPRERLPEVVRRALGWLGRSRLH